jgi:hypothetical protein
MIEPLAVVAEALEGSAVWAYMHGDVRAGDRLLLLSSCVEHEAQYEANVRRGFERVTSPPGKSFGWRVKNDPDVRARRRMLGVHCP